MSGRFDPGTQLLKPTKRLALVDADTDWHHQVRQQLVTAETGWHVDAYADTKQAWQSAAAAPPRLVLMDVCPPTATGIECLRSIRTRLPDVPVVVYTAEQCPGLLLRTMVVGARGYLIKPLPVAAVVAHLHKAMAGGLALCSRAERLLMKGLSAWHPRGGSLGLSPREQEIMLCLCQHGSDKGIATAMGISEATVHAHLARIFKKLNVHDRASALRVFQQKLHGGGVKPTGVVSLGLDPF